MSAPAERQLELNRYPLFAARFWHGMPLGVSAAVLRSGGLANVAPSRWHLVATTLAAGLFNSPLCWLQRRRYGARIAAMKLRQPPVFVIGHWRSGTTLLHEYLALDEKHRAPTTFECFAPSHCLLTGKYLTRLGFLVPAKRPMDDMEAGWNKPQEDDFALMAMGLPSLYRQVAFPNSPPVDLDYLDFADVSGEARRRWQEGLRSFLKLIQFRHADQRLVLKTPSHLGRVRVLLEAFPEARFVHIVRDPYKVFPSTVKLWKALYETQAFQMPRFQGLEEYVLACFERMYAQFDRDRVLVPAGRLHELRYEDLVADPAGELRLLYERLGLGDFGRIAGKLEVYRQRTKDYQTNRFELGTDMRSEIDRRWGPFTRRYGYCGGGTASAVGLATTATTP
jgi:hypothetical protein